MEWDPTSLFRTDTVPANPLAILILNQPINERAFDAVRRHACYTLLADGGANSYYNLAKSRSAESTDLPSCILGDLDSIQPHVRAHYTAHHIPILHDSDQESTDFMKCVRFLRVHAHAIVDRENPALSDNHDLYMTRFITTRGRIDNGYTQRNKRLDVVVFGGLGGRVDQGFSQIHHLYKAHADRRQQSNTTITTTSSSAVSPTEGNDMLGELYLLSEESLSFILPPGKHIIHTPLTYRLDQAKKEQKEMTDKYVLAENVGIIPLAGPTCISLTGFEWDVTRWETEIGGQLSTSNHIRAPRLEVEVDTTRNRPVLFTVELAAGLKKGSSFRP